MHAGHLVGSALLCDGRKWWPIRRGPQRQSRCLGWKDGVPLQVGAMTGVLPPESTVAEGECFAIAKLCSRLEEEADCTTDCKVATSQQHKALRPWPWAQARGKEKLAKLSWTRSHTTEQQHAEEFGAHSSWRRDINAIADSACGEAAKEALHDLPPWDPGRSPNTSNAR